MPDPTGADAGALADRDDLQIALVLNGGVSLAVWMSGAVFQLDRLRRVAPGGAAEAGDSPDATLDRILGALLDLTQRRVVIDLVAGTSAGGINGALLGAAIANGRRLTRAVLLGTWLGVGDLGGLLRPTNQRKPPSLLKGDENLRTELCKIVRGLVPDDAVTADGLPTNVSLMLTGTDLTGLEAKVRPETGPSYREHRILFRFAHPPRKGWAPLAPPTAPAEEIASTLALAGRSSASFPAAFEGSRVPPRPWIVGAGNPPLPLDDSGGVRDVMDGGVLDNSPFEPLLRAMDASPTGAELERTVVFVTPYDDEPQPGDDGDRSRPDDDPAGLLDTVGSAGALRGRLAGVANYVRFSEQVRRYRASQRTDVTRDLLARAEVGQLVASAEAALPAYTNARWRSAVGALVRPEPAPPPEPCSWLPRTFERSFSPWSWGTAPVRRMAAYAARCLADARAEIRNDAVGGPDIRRSLLARERAVRAALGTLSEAERRRVARFEAQPGAPSSEKLDASWTEDERGTRTAIAEGVVGELIAAAATIQTHDGLSPGVRIAAVRMLGVGASVSADELLRALLAAEVVVETGDRGTSAGAEVGPVLELVTLRGGSGGGERQLWVTHALGGEPVRTKAKLLGMSLQHFGGFLFCSWRANDWMFGRLDAADTIARVVLSDDRLREIGATMGPTEREAAAAGLAEALADGLPPDDDPELASLRQALGAPAGAPVGEEIQNVARLALTPAAEAGGSRDRLRAAVAWRMQAEILREELPTVRTAVAGDRKLGALLPGDPGDPSPVDCAGATSAPALPLSAALGEFRRYALPEKGGLPRQWLTAPMVALVARAVFVARAALGRKPIAGAPASVLSRASRPLRLALRLVRGWSSVLLWVAAGVRAALFPAIARSFLPIALVAYLLAEPGGDWRTVLGILAAVVLGIPWLVALIVSLPSAKRYLGIRLLRALVPLGAAALGVAAGVWARTDDDLDQSAAGWLLLGAWLVGAWVVGRTEQRDGIDPPTPRRPVSAP